MRYFTPFRTHQVMSALAAIKLANRAMKKAKGKRNRSRLLAEATLKFENFEPQFSTSSGYVNARLVRVARSKVNGEPVAYYKLSYFDRNAGAYRESLYLYALRRGVP